MCCAVVVHDITTWHSQQARRKHAHMLGQTGTLASAQGAAWHATQPNSIATSAIVGTPTTAQPGYSPRAASQYWALLLSEP